MLLTLTRLREVIVDIAFVGLQNAGIIIKNDSTLVTFGSITQGSGLLTIIGLIITAVFVVRNIKGGMLWAILITTIIGIPMGLTNYQGIISLLHSPAPVFCKFEFDKILTIDMIVIVLSFLSIDLFSLTGSHEGRICG